MTTWSVYPHQVQAILRMQVQWLKFSLLCGGFIFCSHKVTSSRPARALYRVSRLRMQLKSTPSTLPCQEPGRLLKCGGNATLMAQSQQGSRLPGAPAVAGRAQSVCKSTTVTWLRLGTAWGGLCCLPRESASRRAPSISNNNINFQDCFREFSGMPPPPLFILWNSRLVFESFFIGAHFLSVRSLHFLPLLCWDVFSPRSESFAK